MLFKQTINFAQPAYGETGIKVYKNLKQFCNGKSDTTQVR
jgi:hypothetical protein